MNSGGSINLRLSLRGAEQVRAQLADIGPAGAKMARELDRAMRSPGPAMQGLNAAMADARGQVDGLAGRAGVLGTGLSKMGPMGLAAAASIGALALAMGQARESMAWAADLTDTADRIGVATDALQGWRYVADEAGVSIDSFQGNLEKLNASLGAFKSGIGDKKLRPVFESLGITPEQLATVKTADELMLILADTLGQLQDRAVQVKFAKTLGVEESLPILRLGSEAIQTLIGDAEKLGLVAGTDVVEALDAADRQLEIAQQRIDASVRLAVVGLADDFADLITTIAAVVAWFVRLDQAVQRWSPGGDGSKPLQRGIVGWASDQMRGRTGAEGDAARDEGLRNMPAWQRWLGFGGARTGYLEQVDRERAAMSSDMRDLAAGRGEFSRVPGWERPDRPARGGGGGASAAAREAEQRRRAAEREIEQLQAEEMREAQAHLRRTVRDGPTAEARSNAAKLLAESERTQEIWNAAQRRKILEDVGLWTEEQSLRAENLQGLRDWARQDEEQERVRKEAADRQEALNRAEESYLGITQDILSVASSQARTAAERREIELQLLDIAQRRQKADLEAAIEAEKEPAARQRLVDALNRLPELHAAQRGAVERQNAGPLGQWRQDQLQTPAEMKEFLEGRTLDALNGLNDGLRDIWKNADSASDAWRRFGDVAADALGRITDALMEMAIQKWIIEPLVNGIVGGPAGNGKGSGQTGFALADFGKAFAKPGTGAQGGNSLGAIFSSFLSGLGRKGRGGAVSSSGLHAVGEYGMEFARLPVGTTIYDSDRTERMIADMGRPGRAASVAAADVHVTVINRGEPARVERSRGQNGQPVLTLTPLKNLVRGAVTEMGADGALASALGSTPRAISRG